MPLTVKAVWMLPGWNVVTCPRSTDPGANVLADPAGIEMADRLSFWYPKVAS